MKKLTNFIASLLPAFVLLFTLSSPVSAVRFETGDTINLPKEKKVVETVFVGGNTLNIASDIDGDLLCAGKDVVIDGNIKGDVLCAGQNITINGNVDGNIRTLGQYIYVNGLVTRNVYVAGQQLSVNKTSSIKGDVFFGGQKIDVIGSLGRDLAAAGESILISGPLGRDAIVNVANLNITDTAKIGGKLDYYMEKESIATFSSKNIKGQISRHDIVREDKTQMVEKSKEISTQAMAAKKIFSIISYLVLGVCLVIFNRSRFITRMGIITQKPWISLFVGFATFIVLPLAFILVLITIIGIPTAFVLITLYSIALMTSSIYASGVIGKIFCEAVFKNKQCSLIWQVVAGILLLGVVSALPVAGGLVLFFAFCIGMGAFVISYLPEK